jgi:hypothetical protein
VDVSLLVDPLAREGHRVAVLARTKQRLEQARLRRALEQELVDARSDRLRADQERHAAERAAREERRNAARQESLRASLTWREGREREVEAIRSGKADLARYVMGVVPEEPAEQPDAEAEPETEDAREASPRRPATAAPAAGRRERAKTVQLAREALCLYREQDLRAEDRQRRALLEAQRQRRERAQQERSRQRDLAIEQAAQHLDRLDAERRRVAEEKEQLRAEAAARAEEHKRHVQEYFQASTEQKLQAAQARRRREEAEAEARRQAERRREEAREEAIEARRQQLARQSEQARMNKTDSSALRARVYDRAERQREAREAGLVEQMGRAEARSEEAKRRREREREERRQRQEMLLEERREQVDRMRRVEQYRRRKVEERREQEQARVAWVEQQKTLMRRQLDSVSADPGPAPRVGESEHSLHAPREEEAPLPGQLHEAAARVARRLAVPEATAVAVAQHLHRQTRTQPVPLVLAHSVQLMEDAPAARTHGQTAPITARPKPPAHARPRTARPVARRGTGSTTRPATASAPRRPDGWAAAPSARASQRVDHLRDHAREINSLAVIRQVEQAEARTRELAAWQPAPATPSVDVSAAHSPTASHSSTPAQAHHQDTPQHASPLRRKSTTRATTGPTPAERLAAQAATHREHLLALLEAEHSEELRRQALLEASPSQAQLIRLEALFAADRARAAAALQSEQRRQRLEAAELAEELGIPY